MESLTKENFWNAIKEEYPVQMAQFCDWIDEYKKRVKWIELFNADLFSKSDYRVAGVKIENMIFKAPKYHELPIAMQLGIFIQFTIESSKANFLDASIDRPNTMEEWAQCMRDWFRLEP